MKDREEVEREFNNRRAIDVQGMEDRIDKGNAYGWVEALEWVLKDEERRIRCSLGTEMAIKSFVKNVSLSDGIFMLANGEMDYRCIDEDEDYIYFNSIETLKDKNKHCEIKRSWKIHKQSKVIGLGGRK